jgi:hypothetical protein
LANSTVLPGHCCWCIRSFCCVNPIGGSWRTWKTNQMTPPKRYGRKRIRISLGRLLHRLPRSSLFLLTLWILLLTCVQWRRWRRREWIGRWWRCCYISLVAGAAWIRPLHTCFSWEAGEWGARIWELCSPELLM